MSSMSVNLIDKFQYQNNIIFNDEQIELINHIYGSALTLATAGSGKTTTMCARTLNLILNYNIPCYKILTLTYSNESVDDLKNKFKKLASRKIHLSQQEKVHFSTIHSFANRVLYEYGKKMGFKYSLLTEAEARKILKECIVNITGNEPPPRELSNIIGVINRYKNNKHAGIMTTLPNNIVGFNEIVGMYDQIKEKENKIDFNDMIFKAYHLLKDNKLIRQKMQDKYDFIQVDEAQDISRIQYDIIKLIAKDKSNIVLIADDDQTIYGFRGSDPTLLNQYLTDFPNTKKINLDINYRSTKTIVDIARNFIKKNTIRFEKNIKSFNDSQQPVFIIKHKNHEQECSFVIKEIKQKYMQNLGETCVLYKFNIYIIQLLNELNKNKIPFYIKGDTLSFFKHWLKNDIMAITMLAADRTDIRAFEHIYNKYTFDLDTNHYLTKQEVKKVKEVQSQKIRKESIFKVFRSIEEFNNKKRKYMAILENHLNKLEELRGEDILEYILHDMEFKNYIRRIVDGNEHRRNIYLMHVELFKYFLRDNSGVRGLYYTVGTLQLALSQAHTNKHKDALFLSTFHSSKGLEFKNTFLIGLNHGVFPANSPNLKELSSSDIEEERRVMYVGITRAKENLYLSSVKKSSEFVSDIQDIISES